MFAKNVAGRSVTKSNELRRKQQLFTLIYEYIYTYELKNSIENMLIVHNIIVVIKKKKKVLRSVLFKPITMSFAFYGSIYLHKCVRAAYLYVYIQYVYTMTSSYYQSSLTRTCRYVRNFIFESLLEKLSNSRSEWYDIILFISYIMCSIIYNSINRLQ